MKKFLIGAAFAAAATSPAFAGVVTFDSASDSVSATFSSSWGQGVSANTIIQSKDQFTATLSDLTGSQGLQAHAEGTATSEASYTKTSKGKPTGGTTYLTGTIASSGQGATAAIGVTDAADGAFNFSSSTIVSTGATQAAVNTGTDSKNKTVHTTFDTTLAKAFAESTQHASYKFTTNHKALIDVSTNGVLNGPVTFALLDLTTGVYVFNDSLTADLADTKYTLKAGDTFVLSAAAVLADYTAVTGSSKSANGGINDTFNFNISAVPELSTWGMMVAGFASLGFAGYRRRVVA